MYEKLKELREKKGYTIDDLARVIGKSSPNYFKKENGDVKFSVNEALSLVFTGLANKASADTYLKTNYPNWTITGKLGNGYADYLGFGRSGDGTSSITSPLFTATSDFSLTAVIKGNGSDSVMTSTLTFSVLDAEGNVIATSDAITPVDAKDTTYTITFTYNSGKTYADAAHVKISFSKAVGNIGFKSLAVAA